MAKDCAAVIVAGGQGIRFGGKIRKQYLRLGRWPLVWWSLKAFERCPSVSAIVLVVPGSDLEKIRRRTKSWGFKKLTCLIAGGKTRADSVREGLRSMPAGPRWIAIHDAVRPLVTVQTIERVLKEARRYRAAIAASPSKDTVKLSDFRNRIRSTPSRDTVWLAQTPQIFERKLILKAHHSGLNQVVTDDAELVEQLGVRVRLVESSGENVKVTRPLDLALARLVMGSRARV